MKKPILFLCSCLAAAALQAQIIHVPADYPTIQQGIDAANQGDTVLVADSTYYEQINFLGKKPLMVASWFIIDGQINHINNTIIDGSQILDDDTASVVLFISGEDSTSVLCGFTVTGGRGTLDYYPTIVGGGIYARNSGLCIRNNIITANHLDDGNLPDNDGVDGGGVFIDNEIDSWAVVEYNEISYNSLTSTDIQCGGGGIGVIGNARIINNAIKGNSCTQNSSDPGDYNFAGGLYYGSYGSPAEELVLQNNIFENNSLLGINGTGAGAQLEAGIINCTGNMFSGNSIEGPNPQPNGGGGLTLYQLGEGSRISGNTFLNNESVSKGGALYVHATYGWQIIENSYFYNNSARLGGAIASYSCTLILQNNAFYKNYADDAGGAVYLADLSANEYHRVCIINNSFSNNKSSLISGAGGAIFTNQVNPIILNSIFRHDTASLGPEIKGNNPFTEVAFCNIDTNLIFNPTQVIIGEGIMNEDPLFLDDSLLTISDESPCLDEGIAEYLCHDDLWLAPYYDLTGLSRPQSGGWDLGAYEVPFEGILTVPGSQFAVSIYPNPTNATTQFQISNFDYARITLKIYGTQGREVVTVLDKMLPAGEHLVQYDASALPAGIYFYKLAVGSRQLAVCGKLVKY